MGIEHTEQCKTALFGILQIDYLVLHYLNIQELVFIAALALTFINEALMNSWFSMAFYDFHITNCYN